MMNPCIKGISYYLPGQVLTNRDLVSEFRQWSPEKIYQKTGISERHIATGECVSDLAEQAAKQLFHEYGISPSDIDALILCTHHPDYIFPATACILQDRLGLPKTCAAFDCGLGCSGFVYGLAIARSFLVSGMASHILLVMSDTVTKHIHPLDKSTRTLLGDGAAAILVGLEEGLSAIGEFVLGTDGSGWNHLYIPAGGMKNPRNAQTCVEKTDEDGNVRTEENVYMNGPAIFNFTARVVPGLVQEVLEKNSVQFEDIDLFVFHQANHFMLDFLRKKLRIPEDKFYINLEKTGNTGPASIPIAMKMAMREGRMEKGRKVLIAGFGVGLSWGGTILTL